MHCPHRARKHRGAEQNPTFPHHFSEYGNVQRLPPQLFQFLYLSSLLKSHQHPSSSSAAPWLRCSGGSHPSVANRSPPLLSVARAAQDGMTRGAPRCSSPGHARGNLWRIILLGSALVVAAGVDTPSPTLEPHRRASAGASSLDAMYYPHETGDEFFAFIDHGGCQCLHLRHKRSWR